MTAGGPSRALWLIGLATTPFITAFAMLGLLAPLMALDLGASPALVGMLVASKAFVPVLLAVPIGSLIDRIGGYWPTAIALAVAVISTAAVALLPDVAVLFGSQMVFGTSQLVFMVASQRLVSGLRRGLARERDFGWYSTFQSAGQMVGPVLAGAVLDLAGFRFAYLATAALVTVALVASMLTRRPARVAQAASPASEAPAARAPSDEADPASVAVPEEATERDLREPPDAGRFGGIRGLLRNPGFLMAVAVSCTVLLSQSVRQSFLPLYLESLAMSGTIIGIIISSRGLVSMLVRSVLPAIVRLLGGRSRTLLIMVGAIVLGIGLTSFVSTLPGLLIAAALVGVGGGITQPLSMVTVADHVHPRQLGLALGVRLTVNRLAQVLGPLLIGVVAELAGVRWVFLAAAAMLAAAMPLMRAWQPAFDRIEREVRGGEAQGVEQRG